MKTTRKGFLRAHRYKAGPGYVCSSCGMTRKHRLHQSLFWRMTHRKSLTHRGSFR